MIHVAVTLALLQLTSDDPVMGETIVTASRAEEAELDAPYALDVVGEEQWLRRAYRTVPQALRDTPGVLLQETSFGQGSPFIRGFTGFRNVFLIDGIRLNNSVFRSGPNQYWATVDGQSIERLEILKGPAAVIHGSDAIGGAVQALTRSPENYDRPFSGRFYSRLASAERSWLGRLEGDARLDERTGVLFGVTARDFGDLQGGSDTGRQENTGYGEWAADVKVEHYLDDDTRLTFLHQRMQQNNVPRTHRTIFAVPFEGSSVGSDLRRDLDQDRDLTYVQLFKKLDGEWADTMNLSLSWHRQAETRDRIRSSMAREIRGFTVGSLGTFANFTKATDTGDWSYGFDYYRDNVNSFSSNNPIQGPVGDDASYDLLGIYVQDEFELDEKWKATVGLRGTYAAADAKSVQDPITSNPIEIEDDWSALTASARVVYEHDPGRLHFFGGISQGFRAPSLSDLTRLDSARSNEFEIPSPGLEPEKTVTFELGAKGTVGRATGQAALFYTSVNDLILRVPTGNVNGEGEFEIAKANVGDGFVAGLELAGEIQLDDSFSLFGNLTLQDGEVSTFPTSAPVEVDEPLDRLMPPTGQVGLRWEDAERKGWAELVLVGADGSGDLSTRDAADTTRIPPGGTPGYLVAHLRGGYRISQRSRLDLALDNLTNEDYRVHGSGTNMPGFNAILGWTYSW